jgi:hypothetical protein
MAQSVTGDSSVLAILKEYYGTQDVEALVFRNSPVLGRIRKERIGGKYIPLPMAAYGSGAVTADFTQVTQQAANSYLGVSMLVQPGQLFSSFVLDPKEFLASDGDRSAFVSVFAIRAMLAMDDLRKTLATCLYRQGYLEMGPVLALDTNRLYVDIDASTAMALSPGSQIMFAATAQSVYRNPNAVVISSIQTIVTSGLTRVTFSSAYDATVAVADQVMIKGGRDTSLLPNAPSGFGSWLPSVAGRVGAAWTTYIGTAFYGVVRSVAPDRLAGQFVQRSASSNESYTAALLRGIKLARRGGGVPDMIIVNDDDFNILINDALANRTFYQDIQGATAKEKNVVRQGISQFDMAVSTSFINMVYDDPYCPKGTAYIIDIDSVRLFGLSNTAPILEKLPIGNEPGAPKISSGDTPATNFQFLVDDMYTTSPVALQSGMGLRVDFQFYGNFAVVAPAHNCVVLF